MQMGWRKDARARREQQVTRCISQLYTHPRAWACAPTPTVTQQSIWRCRWPMKRKGISWFPVTCVCVRVCLSMRLPMCVSFSVYITFRGESLFIRARGKPLGTLISFGIIGIHENTYSIVLVLVYQSIQRYFSMCLKAYQTAATNRLLQQLFVTTN